MKSIELKNHNSIVELRRELRYAKDGRYLLRLQCIILKKEGKKPKEIQEILLISRVSYGKWIRRYNEEGLNGLRSKKSTGRKEKWDNNLFKELFEELDKNRGF